VQHELLHNERELLQQVAAGNIIAFRNLFAAYYDRLYSAALVYCKIHEQAEDVVQQVFMKVWEKRHTLSQVEQPGDYLFIITRNEVLNQLRRNTLHDNYIRHIRELFSEETGSPEEVLVARQKRQIVQQAISQLPPQQQEAFRLSRDQGLSYEEIAATMNLSLSTVKGHMSKALQAVRAYCRLHQNELLIMLLWSLCHLC
jgi:RNA polymerase sigma-70 factor (family 1)